MALLDRFKTQAPLKHPDAAVRLAYVAEIPIDDREQLASVAREDEEPRVRRAAAAKLMDPPALAAIAREDADEGVRAQAIDMLRDIAVEAFEGIGEAESLSAVDALASLADSKTLGVVAKNAAREPVARAALARVSDQRALGSIARHGSFEGLRLAALARIEDHAEVLAVAMNSEFKDTALEALAQVTSREELERVAERAKNKSSAKRARAIVRDMDEREAAAAAQAAEEKAALARRDAEAAARREAEEAARSAGEQQAAGSVAENAAAGRQQAAARAAAEADAARKREEQAAAAERARAEKSAADALKDAERQAARAVEQAAEEKVAQTRREALARMQQITARVENLATKVLAPPPEGKGVESRSEIALKTIERALNDIRAALADMPMLPSRKDHDDIARRLKTAQAALTPKALDLREAESWKRFANAGVQEQLCARMEALKAVEDPETLAKEIRALQMQWREVADVPRAQAEALWRRFKAAHDEIWPRCEAYFAAQNEERTANLAAKIALCERAEALADSTRWIETANEIKSLQAQWKTIGPVTRGQEKAIWDRFRVACDRFFTRRQDDLGKRKALWAENYQKKEALVAQAEALAQSTDWEPAAAAIKQLQAQWKTIGPVKKTRSEAIWQRFRGACDQFFERYAHRHDIAKAERVAAREAIVQELEALAQSPVAGPHSPDEPTDQPPATSPQPPQDLAATLRTLRSNWQREIAARGVDRDTAVALDKRFQTAFSAIVDKWPAAFAGTEFDTSANRSKMEAIVKRVEDLAASLSGGAAAGRDAALTPATRLASMLKEALAANTIGGKVDDSSRFRAAQDDLRNAQAAWARIGPVPEAARRALADRFNRACRAIEQAGGRAGK